MKTEKLFHDLLGLGMNWEVLECEFEKSEGIVRIRVGETQHLWESERSPGEGARVKLYDHTQELEWRHLNVFEHRCEIRCRLPRGQCTKTGKVYRVTPPWEGLSKHFMKAFEAFALLLMREIPVLAVSRKVKETDTRLWRMLKAHVAMAYPQADWSQVGCVGCDEMSVRKGHRYINGLLRYDRQKGALRRQKQRQKRVGGLRAQFGGSSRTSAPNSRGVHGYEPGLHRGSR